MRTLLTTPLVLLTLLLPSLVQGQSIIYRQVDATGGVIFSDRPMGDAAQKTTVAGATGSGPASADQALPFALRETVQRFPVTLFTAKDCAPCDSGRKLLQQRGIPFSEKTIATPEDAGAMTRLSGSTSVPLLTVGKQQLKGYSDSSWTQYLTAAGYPSTGALPANYRNPNPTPLVELVVSKPELAQPQPSPVPQEPVQPANRASQENPAGIIF
jgi:glutaredoxin